MSMDVSSVSDIRTSIIRAKTRENYKDTIEYIIESPFRCGFLLAFCRSQFSSENLCFLIAVMQFKDMMGIDSRAWTRNWREIDDILDNSKVHLAQHWPSSRVSRQAACESMQKIVDTYLTGDAKSEICISQAVLINTLRRVSLVHIYGPEVFTEATIDPFKTMKKDILPRFKASRYYEDMQYRIRSCRHLPSASELRVEPPSGRMTYRAKLKDFPIEKRFELEDFLECEILYTEFLIFLKRTVSSENLLCLQLIITFEEYMINNNLPDAEEQAWTIYIYFIAPGSAYEISLNYRHRKELMLLMASPTIDMFDEVKKSVRSALTRDFDAFSETSAYEGLSKMMRESLRSKSYTRFSCLG